jgi:hypothetical protein
MIRLMFDCPATGEPLRTGMRFGGWPEGRSLVTKHCPKCGGTHSFRREDAIYAMDAGARAELAGASS